MTEEEQIRKEEEMRARRDIQDIQDLRKFPAFQRYWLRRLEQRRNEIYQRFRGDPATKVLKNDKGEEYVVDVCTPEEREILRRILNELEDLMGMLERDEGSARVQVDRLHQ